jgi:hypothetical protein
MTLNCRPGDLCIVTRSRCGNEGREVEVVRWILSGPGCIPEMPSFYDHTTSDGWLCRARDPFATRPGTPATRYAVFPDNWLLPLRPPAEPRADVERETDFAYG